MKVQAVTIDVLEFRRLRDALGALRRPETLFGGGPRFLQSFLVGRGGDLHGPWEPQTDLSIRAGAARRDGWGLPSLRRVAVLAAWETGEPPPARPGGELRERWRGLFGPGRGHGTVHGADPLEGAALEDWKGRPGAVFTQGLGGGRLLEFLRQNNHVVEQLHQSQGLLLAGALFGIRGGQAALCTLSCWTDLDDALRFAYRNAPEHRAAIHRQKSGYYGAETYFARLVLRRSEGTVAGRDPFATGALPAEAAMPEAVRAARPVIA